MRVSEMIDPADTSSVDSHPDPMESTSGEHTAGDRSDKSGRVISPVFADFVQSFLRLPVAAWLGWQDAVLPFRRAYVGLLWPMIQTTVWVMMIALLLGPSLGAGSNTYVPYVASGMVVFLYLSSLMVDGAAAFTKNAGLIQNIPNPLMLYLLRAAFKQMVLFVVQAPVLIGAFLVSGLGVQASALWAVPGFLLATWAIMGLALGLASITPRLRDIPFALNAAMRVMFFATPIFWQMDGVGLRQHVAAYNPFAHLLNIVREPLLGHAWPMDSVVICAIGGAISWVVGIILFSRTRPYIAAQL